LSHQVTDFYKDAQREYRKCTCCDLIYVPDRFHLTARAERERYDTHQNSLTDPGYRQFLARLMSPLVKFLKPGQQGLDFGCGPSATLAHMLQEQGYPMSVFDPFYANDVSVLQQQYHFVTCSEAIEHFSRADLEWRRLLGMLVEGGHLAIMTQLCTPELDFASWYYKNDPTHICFYSLATFAWLAQRDKLELKFSNKSVVIFEK
jgi:2-polyprenyl-3-methyl-5-hydroxy-6-metoxy-1,4-benzoquinol methylase